MATKKERLFNSIVAFEKSEEKNLQEYMEMFYAVVAATKQGDGMLWKDVEGVVKNAILEVDLLS